MLQRAEFTFLHSLITNGDQMTCYVKNKCFHFVQMDNCNRTKKQAEKGHNLIMMANRKILNLLFQCQLIFLTASLSNLVELWITLCMW